MNKLKVIPFLALVAMLSACTVNGSAAKMKKYSKEVDYATWKENLASQNVGQEEGEEENQHTDFGTTIAVSMTDTDKTVLGNKVLVEEKTIAGGKLDGKYDKDNDVGVLTTNLEMKMVGEDSIYNSNMVIKANGSRIYQKGTIEGADKTIAVDKKHKTYYVAGDYTEGSISSEIIGMAMGPMAAFAMLPAAYESEFTPEEEKAKYSFYQDGKLFTVKYVDVEEEEPKETIGGEQVTYAHKKTTKTTIAQALYTQKGSKTVSAVLNMETIEEVETSYLVDYNSYAKDTVRTQIEDTIFNVKVELKDVKLESVDIANYKLGAGNGAIMFGD